MVAAGSSEMTAHFYLTTFPLDYSISYPKKQQSSKTNCDYDQNHANESFIQEPESLQNPKCILHFTHCTSSVLLFSEGD